jgi:hypothetical protein
MKSILPAFFILVHSFSAHAQCLLQHIPLPARIAQSQVVIEGQVIGSYAFVSAHDGHIYTANQVMVSKVLKGKPSLNQGKYTIITQGGTVGDRMERVYPSLQLHAGQSGVFMLGKPLEFEVSYSTRTKGPGHVMGAPGSSGPSSYIAYNPPSLMAVDVFETFANRYKLLDELAVMAEGKWVKMGDLNLPIESSHKKAGITGFSPTTIAAGNGNMLTIEGSGFGTDYGAVGFANADNGGQTTLQFTDSIFIVSWTDTKIEVYVPRQAGSGNIQVVTSSNTTYTSPSSLTVSYARLEVDANGPTTNPGHRRYATNLENDNGTGGYTWKFHGNFLKERGAVLAIMRAMQTWRCSTGLHFDVDTTNATYVDKADRDGVHTIMWQNPNQTISTGALAVTFSQWSGCYNATTKDWHWFLNDVDMVFDDALSSGRTWNYGPANPTSNQYDMESVALHELGHAHQLGHIINPNGVMHYSIKNGEHKRNLSSDSDIPAGKDVMNTSTTSTGCSGVSAMTKITSNCKLLDIVDVVADFTLSATEGCVGDTIVATNNSVPANSNLNWKLPPLAVSMNGLDQETLRFVLQQAGSFKVGLVVENQGFLDSIYLDVKSNAIPITGVKVDIPACYGDKGKATLILTAGQAPFTITWLASGAMANPQNLPAGTHHYRCIDKNGCQLKDSIVMAQPDSLYMSGWGSEPTWGGLARGKAWVQMAGGTPPYAITWNDGNSQKTDTATNLLAGSYTATATDNNGCQADITIDIEGRTDIQEGSTSYGIKIYPNPARHDLTVIWPEGGNALATIHNLEGKSVWSQALSAPGAVHMGSLLPGAYVLTIVTDHMVYREAVQILE